MASGSEATLLELAGDALQTGNAQKAHAYLARLWDHQQANPPRHLRPFAPPSKQDPLAAACALELGRPRWRNLPPIEQLRACAEDCRWRAVLAEPYYLSAARELEDVAAELLRRAVAMETRVATPIRVEPGQQLPRDWMERARVTPIHDVLTALGCTQTGRGRYTPCPACRGQSRRDRRGSVVLRGNRWTCVLCSEGGSAVDAVGWHLVGCEPTGRDQLFQVGAWLMASSLI